MNLLEGSLFDQTNLAGNASGGPDFRELVESSRQLRIGEETAWKWQVDKIRLNDSDRVCFHARWVGA